jgi:shikimate dehydrogenase
LGRTVPLIVTHSEIQLTIAHTPDRALAVDTRVGLFGQGILASRSPWLHEREAVAQGVSLRYTLFDFADMGRDVNDLPAMLAQAEADGFAGLNITFPFKQAVIPLLDSLSDGAARIGAVNTVQFKDGKRIGHNTDVTGFAKSMRRELPGAALGAVLQLGAGGAGSATAQALLELGAEQVMLYDGDASKVASLVAKLNQHYGSGRAVAAHDLAVVAAVADGIVNTTPMGMAKFPGSAIPAAFIVARHWVADIVYFPLETELLRAARAVGCQTMDGSGMNVFQAAEAFDIFTGLSADRERMLASFLEFAPSSPEPVA